MAAVTIEEENDRQALKTEGPISEKDQQGQATERQRKLAETALAKWRRLKEKITRPFNK